MHITKEELLAEQAGLEQQQARWRATIQKAEAVKQQAAGNLLAVDASLKLVAHLMNKIQLKEQSNGRASDDDTDGSSRADGQQEAPGGPPAQAG